VWRENSSHRRSNSLFGYTLGRLPPRKLTEGVTKIFGAWCMEG